jgi:hypothetical protein
MYLQLAHPKALKGIDIHAATAPVRRALDSKQEA